MPENPTPQVIDLSNLYRQQLLAREKEAASRITRYYGEIWGRLQGDIAALQAEVAAKRAAGEIVTENSIWRMERMQRIQRQAERELSQFAQFASDEVAALQREALEAAQRNAHDLLAASFPEGAGVEIAFGAMPVEAVEQMVGFVADGSPLLEIIQGYVGEGVQAFSQQLVTGLAMGLGPRESARLLRAQFGMPLSNALRITRTEQMRAYRAATLNSYRQNSHIVTRWKRLAARSDRTCLACIMLDGTVYDLAQEMDDHVQGRCVAPGTLVHGRSIIGFVARYYRGDMLDISFASGQFLSVTPNHPILTDRGWIAAKLLERGDNVVCRGFLDGATAGVNPNKDDVPIPIEDIPSTLGMSRFTCVPGTAEDFHGDGMESEVYVVATNSLLRDRRQSATPQPVCEKSFGGRDTNPELLSRLGYFTPMFRRLLTATRRFLSNLDAAMMFFYRCLCGQQPVGFGLAASGKTQEFQLLFYNASGDTIGFSEGVLGFPGQVSLGDFLGWKAKGLTARFAGLERGKAAAFFQRPEKAARLECLSKPTVTNVELGRSVISTSARDICFDRVLKVDSRSFSGHVYNLQTKSSWYNAGNSIAHNGGCVKLPVVHNCAVVPITVSYASLGIDAPEPGFIQETAAEWFRRQPGATQQEIMGPGMWEAWQAGEFALEDVPKLIENDVWGNAWVPKSLKELTG